MYFIETHARKILIVLMFAISAYFFTSCNFSTTKDSSFALSDSNNEEKTISQFLVKSTDINNTIIQLSKIVATNSNSAQVKDFFIKQIELTNDIQMQIKLISEDQFVAIPITKRYSKPIYTNDVAALNLLYDNLSTLEKLFESISNTTSSLKIINLKNKFLPIIQLQTQKLSELKQNKQ